MTTDVTAADLAAALRDSLFFVAELADRQIDTRDYAEEDLTRSQIYDWRTLLDRWDAQCRDVTTDTDIWSAPERTETIHYYGGTPGYDDPIEILRTQQDDGTWSDWVVRVWDQHEWETEGTFPELDGAKSFVERGCRP